MKKKLIRIAAVILLLLIFLKTFLYIREYNSYKNNIYKNADVVIKINVDGIIKTMVGDCITSPGYYWNHKEATKKDTVERGKGISIPANIFIYTVKEKSSKTFFCSLPVSDTGKLKRYFADKLSIDSFYTASGETIGESADHKATILFNNKNVVIAYSIIAEPVLDVAREILLKKNMLSLSDPLIKNLKQQNDHITFLSAKGSGNIHFADGKASFKVLIKNEDILSVNDNITHRKLSGESIVNGWLNASMIKQIPNASFTIKDITLNADSLLKNYNGYADFELNSKEIMQEDSVITYSYNDDFEKVPEVTVSKNKVPEVNLTMKANVKDLYNYLYTRDVIKNNEIINRDLFPLCAMHVLKNDSFVHISTNKDVFYTDAVEASRYFFYLFADIEKIKTANQFAFVKKYITNMQSLEIKATKKDNDMLQVEGELNMLLKHINALPQLDE